MNWSQKRHHVTHKTYEAVHLGLWEFANLSLPSVVVGSMSVANRVGEKKRHLILQMDTPNTFLH